MLYSQPDKPYTTFEYLKMRKVCQNMITAILQKISNTSYGKLSKQLISACAKAGLAQNFLDARTKSG